MLLTNQINSLMRVEQIDWYQWTVTSYKIMVLVGLQVYYHLYTTIMINEFYYTALNVIRENTFWINNYYYVFNNHIFYVKY